MLATPIWTDTADLISHVPRQFWFASGCRASATPDISYVELAEAAMECWPPSRECSGEGSSPSWAVARTRALHRQQPHRWAKTSCIACLFAITSDAFDMQASDVLHSMVIFLQREPPNACNPKHYTSVHSPYISLFLGTPHTSVARVFLLDKLSTSGEKGSGAWRVAFTAHKAR